MIKTHSLSIKAIYSSYNISSNINQNFKALLFLLELEDLEMWISKEAILILILILFKWKLNLFKILNFYLIKNFNKYKKYYI